MAGFQVSMILFALFYSIHPSIIIFQDGTMSLKEAAAGLATMNALGIALLVGSVFILPSLIYLIYSFQRRSIEVLGGEVNIQQKTLN